MLNLRCSTCFRRKITAIAGRRATAKAAEAFDQVVYFLESFEALDDHRHRGKVIYPLDEILLLVLLVVLTGCDCWVEIERFGETKLDSPRRFRLFKDGTPSHEQLGDIFAQTAAPCARQGQPARQA